MSRKEVLCFCRVVWKAASVKRIFQSGFFKGENAVQKVWRRGENISYQGILDVYFMQREAELNRAGYAIFDWFAHTMGFPKKLLESSELPSNYVRMSLHAFLACMH